MNLRAIFFIYIGFIFSYNMVEHDQSIIESNTLIVKFSKSYAPLLGSENPLSLESIEPFQLIDNTENLKDLSPVFNHIENFTVLHYEHNHHQYYKSQYDHPGLRLHLPTHQLQSYFPIHY